LSTNELGGAREQRWNPAGGETRSCIALLLAAVRWTPTAKRAFDHRPAVGQRPWSVAFLVDVVGSDE
jgi:hypothetical protein